MKKAKKIFSVLLATMMVAALFTACGSDSSSDNDSAANDNADKKVGVVSLIENGAFTDMRDGIIEELEAQGYSEDNIEYQCAAGDSTALSTIVGNMTDGTYDMVFTIATPATQAFVNAESDTPVFFCAVSSPVEAGVITDMDAPDKNATGTSNAIPISEIFELAQSTTPAEKYGLIYSGNEDNATATIAQAKEYLDEQGIEYVEKTAPTSADIETAVNALVSEGVDAIFVPNDSVIQDGVSVLVDICNENKIPTYASSATTVESGCLATLAIDDKGIGKQTVDLAMEYANDGTPISEIPAVVVGIDYCSVNPSAMEALGLTIDDIVTDYEVQELGE